MKVKLENIFKPALVLFIICLVVTAALAFTYNTTKDTIDQRAVLDAENARKEVLSESESFKQLEDDEVIDITEKIPGTGIVKEVYEGIKDTGTAGTGTAGFVFNVTNKGYGGEIDVIVGIDMTGKVTGVKIGKNTETPGLGSKATDKPFLSQLTGIVPKGPLKVIKGESSGKDEEISAVSGATVSSRAIVEAVQAALNVYKELAKERGIAQ